MLTTTYTLSATTPLPSGDAVERLSAELTEEGFGVLCEIDVQATLREKLGAEGEPYLILGACNPPLSARWSTPGLHRPEVHTYKRGAFGPMGGSRSTRWTPATRVAACASSIRRRGEALPCRHNLVRVGTIPASDRSASSTPSTATGLGETTTRPGRLSSCPRLVCSRRSLEVAWGEN
jgi:Domain of unknown function DUF302